ncbi:MAG: cupin domain-containing protein [Proteobacteria bacterium]|nr:cupin domain-containing protein [Pseudomonadota bacterium]MCH7957257.1 cupin domain-containing protein [Pseudomonadota bacterium]
MKRTIVALSLTVAAAVALGAFGIQSVGAAEQEYKPKAKATELIQEALPGVAGKKVIIKHFALPPGHVGGRHFHPGPVYVYVVEGALTIETEGGATQTIPAGELYKEPLGRTMRARNVSTNDWTRIVVFQVGDEGKPMMIKAK